MVFLLSAVWKITHRAKSTLALRQATAGYLPPAFAGWTRVLVIAIESGVSVALYVPGWSIGGSIAAAFAIAVFSVAIAAAPDVAGGCGCWRETGTRTPKRYYLVRNGLICGAAMVGIPLPGPSYVSATQIAFSTAVGLLFGVLLLELPGVASVARTATPLH